MSSLSAYSQGCGQQREPCNWGVISVTANGVGPVYDELPTSAICGLPLPGVMGASEYNSVIKISARRCVFFLTSRFDVGSVCPARSRADTKRRPGGREVNRTAASERSELKPTDS